MIRQSLLTCAVLSLLSACSTTSSQQNLEVKSAASVQAFKQYSAETFYDTVNVMGSSFSNDGKSILVSSDETGIFNLYEFEVEPFEEAGETAHWQWQNRSATLGLANQGGE